MFHGVQQSGQGAYGDLKLDLSYEIPLSGPLRCMLESASLLGGQDAGSLDENDKKSSPSLVGCCDRGPVIFRLLFQRTIRVVIDVPALVLV